jgi:hypothetical protein
MTGLDSLLIAMGDNTTKRQADFIKELAALVKKQAGFIKELAASNKKLVASNKNLVASNKKLVDLNKKLAVLPEKTKSDSLSTKRKDPETKKAWREKIIKARIERHEDSSVYFMPAAFVTNVSAEHATKLPFEGIFGNKGEGEGVETYNNARCLYPKWSNGEKWYFFTFTITVDKKKPKDTPNATNEIAKMQSADGAFCVFIEGPNIDIRRGDKNKAYPINVDLNKSDADGGKYTYWIEKKDDADTFEFAANTVRGNPFAELCREPASKKSKKCLLWTK